MAERGEHATHGQFADNTNVIFEARREYINETFAIFQLKGEALGLYVKTTGVKAVLSPLNQS